VTIRRNTLYNLTAQVAGVAISLLTVPPFLRLIGEARYGVLLIVWLLLGYSSLFDLGLSQATAQRMATLRDAPPEERSRLLWTALRLNGLLGAGAALVLYVAARLVLGSFVDMSDALREESLAALPWIAIALPVSMSASTLTGALQGREAFGATSALGTLGQLLTQVLPLAVAWRLTSSLAWLIPAALVSRPVTLLLAWLVCRRVVPLVGPARRDVALGRSLLRYGGWVTVSSIVGPLMSSFDRLLIGGISGSQAVTYYGVPQGLAARFLMVPSALSGTLFPRFASSTPERRAELAGLSMKVLACAMTPAIVAGLFLVEPFLTVWISAEFAARATLAAQIILVGVWANGLALIAHSSLQASGRPDVVAKIHLVELPAYLAVLAVFLHGWAVTGAAVAWSLRVAVDGLLLYGMAGYLRIAARSLAVPSLLLGLAVAAATILDPSRTRWFAGGGILLAATGWAMARFPWHILPARAAQRG